SLLCRNNGVRTAGLWVCLHGRQDLALKLLSHLLKPLDRVADFVDENPAQHRIGHAEPGLNHVAVDQIRRVKEAALGANCADGPAIAQWIGGCPGAANSWYAKAPFDREHGARAVFMSTDGGSRCGATPANNENVSLERFHRCEVPCVCLGFRIGASAP